MTATFHVSARLCGGIPWTEICKIGYKGKPKNLETGRMIVYLTKLQQTLWPKKNIDEIHQAAISDRLNG